MKVLIFGSSGQTGSYLVQKLLEEGNHVIGVARRKFPYALFNEELFTEIVLDPTEKEVLERIIDFTDFDAVVNFLSLSSVAECEKNSEVSKRINFEFAASLFNFVSKKSRKTNTPIRIIQASSSEMYGGYPSGTLIDETLSLNPISTYGKHKSLAHLHLEQVKVENELISASSLILFNHESPRRDSRFVTKKIIDTIYEISKGMETTLHLGDIEVKRDWGYAADFAIGIAEVLSSSSNLNFVIATGSLHSVKDFCDETFENFGIPVEKRIIVCEKSLMRSRNNNGLAGSTDLIGKELNWRPKVGFQELVRILASSKLGE